MATALEITRREVERHLKAMEAYFKPGARLTLLIRHPDVPDVDMVFTRDDLDEAIRALERLKGEGS